MYCSQCGYKMPGTAKYCTNCGAKLISPQGAAAPAASFYTAPAAAPVQAPKKKKRHVFLTILLIVLVLLIAGGVLLVSQFPLYRYSRVSADIRGFSEKDPAFLRFTEQLESGWLLVDDSGTVPVYSFLSTETGLGYEDKSSADLNAEFGGKVTVKVMTTPDYAYFVFSAPDSYDTLTVTFEKATFREKADFLLLYLK